MCKTYFTVFMLQDSNFNHPYVVLRKVRACFLDVKYSKTGYNISNKTKDVHLSTSVDSSLRITVCRSKALIKGV